MTAAARLLARSLAAHMSHFASCRCFPPSILIIDVFANNPKTRVMSSEFTDADSDRNCLRPAFSLQQFLSLNEIVLAPEEKIGGISARHWNLFENRLPEGRFNRLRKSWARNWAAFWAKFSTRALVVETCLKTPNMTWARNWA